MPLKEQSAYTPFNWLNPSTYGVESSRDITDEIKNGFGYLYKKDYESHEKDKKRFSNLKFYKTPTGYSIASSKYVPRFDEIEVGLSYIRSLLPKRDYLGGKDVRRKVFDKIPGLQDSLIAVASRYNIDPNLMYERLQHEGFLDQQAREYNNEISAAEQKTFFNEFPSRLVHGFNSFGLDDSGRKLLNRDLHTIKSLKNWFPINVTNEKGEQKTSLILDNLWDALEVKGAELQDFQNRMRKRGFVGDDLNTWTNASYNLGAFHKKLRDSTYVRKNYNVPDWGFKRNTHVPLDQFRLIEIKK